MKIKAVGITKSGEMIALTDHKSSYKTRAFMKIIVPPASKDWYEKHKGWLSTTLTVHDGTIVFLDINDEA